MARLLLTRDGVDMNEKDRYGSTPLSSAAQYGHAGVIELLLAREDLDVNSMDKDRRTPLLLAVGRWHGKMTKKDIERELFSDAPYESGNVDEVVALLLQRSDVNVNSKDEDGRTPLSFAAERGFEKVLARLLLAHGDVELESKDKFGRTN